MEVLRPFEITGVAVEIKLPIRNADVGRLSSSATDVFLHLAGSKPYIVHDGGVEVLLRLVLGVQHGPMTSLHVVTNGRLQGRGVDALHQPLDEAGIFLLLSFD